MKNNIIEYLTDAYKKNPKRSRLIIGFAAVCLVAIVASAMLTSQNGTDLNVNKLMQKELYEAANRELGTVTPAKPREPCDGEHWEQYYRSGNGHVKKCNTCGFTLSEELPHEFEPPMSEAALIHGDSIYAMFCLRCTYCRAQIAYECIPVDDQFKNEESEVAS